MGPWYTAASRERRFSINDDDLRRQHVIQGPFTEWRRRGEIEHGAANDHLSICGFAVCTPKPTESAGHSVTWTPGITLSLHAFTITNRRRKCARAGRQIANILLVARQVLYNRPKTPWPLTAERVDSRSGHTGGGGAHMNGDPPLSRMGDGIRVAQWRPRPVRMQSRPVSWGQEARPSCRERSRATPAAAAGSICPVLRLASVLRLDRIFC